MWPLGFKAFLLIRLSQLFVFALADDSTLSIQNKDGLAAARVCVQGAFINWDSGGLWNGALQCQKNAKGAYLNSCVCRCDLRPLAESYITSYIKSACSSNTIDIQSGLLFYDGYCATAVTSSCTTGALPLASPAILDISPDAPNSIVNMDGFAAARVCVQGAFINWDSGGLWNGALQCQKGSNGFYPNSCICRCDLRSLAETYISNYIKTGCTSNTIDIQSGLLFYDGYCATAVTSSCTSSHMLSVAPVVLNTSPDAPNSIFSVGELLAARACVQSAFINWDSGGLWNGALQCQKNAKGAYLNSCICRCDLRPLAETYISNFIKTCSSNAVDIQSGVWLYDSYCANAVTVSSACIGSLTTQGAGIAVPTPTLTAPSSIQTSTQAAPVPTQTSTQAVKSTSTSDKTDISMAPPTNISSATSTAATMKPSTTANPPSTTSDPNQPSNQSGGSGGGGLSQSDKIALGTGLSIPLAALIVAGIGLKYQRNQARQRREDVF